MELAISIVVVEDANAAITERHSVCIIILHHLIVSGKLKVEHSNTTKSTYEAYHLHINRSLTGPLGHPLLVCKALNTAFHHTE